MKNKKEYVRIRISQETFDKISYYKKANKLTFRELYLLAINWIQRKNWKGTYPAVDVNELKSIRFDIDSKYLVDIRAYCKAHGLNHSRLLERALQEIVSKSKKLN